MFILVFFYITKHGHIHNLSLSVGSVRESRDKVEKDIETAVKKKAKTSKNQTIKTTPKTLKPKAPRKRKVRTIKKEGATTSIKRTNSPQKRKKLKKKATHWSDKQYFWFYFSIFGYLLFFIELLIDWFLTNEIISFLRLFFYDFIEKPYIPTIIGAMFLKPLHTYLKGTDSPFLKMTLVGFFFIVRDVSQLLYLWML